MCPTFLEAGVKFKNGTWFGLLAPAGTPPEILSALHEATVDTLHDPEVGEKLRELGVEVIASSPVEFRRFLEQETERLSAAIRAANVTME